jgi:hypothetical protein
VPQTAPPEPPPAPVKAAERQDFDVPTSPASLVVVEDALLWTDSLGAIWTMPAAGGEAKQLSDQQHPSFAFHVFVAGGQAFATSRRDLLRIAPDHSVTLAGVTGLVDYPEESVADAAAIYLTVFKHPEIVKAPTRGGKAGKLATLPRSILAVHGDTLYAASYTTGVMIAVPTAGGRAQTVVRGLHRPTALVADERYVYVYSETDKALTRIEIATGTTTPLAGGLINSDDLVLDGPWLYTYSWGKPATLWRIAKDGSQPPKVLASDLASPSDIAFDATSIYVASRDQNRIVKLPK